MFAPFVASRTEKSNVSASLRIARELLLAFELIAEWATQAKIFKLGRAICRSWRDVVNVKSRHRHFLRGLAVFAAIGGGANNLLVEFSRQARHS